MIPTNYPCLKYKENKELKINPNTTSKKSLFLKELRQYSEQLDLLNDIYANPSKLFKMNEDELNYISQLVENRNKFLEQRILELKNQLSKISKKDN